MKKMRGFIAAFTALLFFIQPLFLPAYGLDESSAGNFTVVVDYYAERVKIIPFMGTDIIEVGTQAESAQYNTVGETAQFTQYITQYMYALDTVSDEILRSYENNPKKTASLLAQEKWYPIYGGEIGIEKAIPKKPVTETKKMYYIAVREAGDMFTGSFGYLTRISVPIKPRLYDKNLKKLLEYDADNEEYKLSPLTSFSDLEIMYSFDNFGYNFIRLSKNSGSLNVNSEYYFSGGSLKIKTAPIVTPDGSVQYASSEVIKYTIPKAGAIPAVKSDSSKYALVLLKKDKIEWALRKDDEIWTTYSESASTVLYKDFREIFKIDLILGTDSEGNRMETVTKDRKPVSTDPLTQTPYNEQYYVIYFRTKAVKGKTPASPVKAVYISRAEAEAVLQ